MDYKVFGTGTIFITGISASGKSTLGRQLRDTMLKSGINNVMLLDGGDLRDRLEKQGKRCGYSADERNRLALEFAHIASEYNRDGYICILCSICHVKEIRQEMRRIIGNVMEVYLDCPVSISAERDYKGQYTKAFQGLLDNFIGVTEPYQKSDHVDLTLHTGKHSIEECSRILYKSVITFLKVGQVKTEQDFDRVKDAI